MFFSIYIHHRHQNGENYQYRWLRCLHCRLTARRSLVRFLHGALLALGGRSSPDLQCSGGLSPRAFCVEFACSPRVHKGFPPIRTPTEKHAKKNSSLSCPSVTDGSLGPRALRSCPQLLDGPGERTAR